MTMMFRFSAPFLPLLLWVAAVIGFAHASAAAAATATISEKLGLHIRQDSLDDLHLTNEEQTKIHEAFSKFDKAFHSKNSGSGIHRILQPSTDRPCNSLLTNVSTAEVKELTNLFLTVALSSPTMVTAAKQFLNGAVKYDVEIWKVCGKCADFESTNPSMSNYCGQNYGYDATHSALVMLPVKNGKVLQGYLRGLLLMHQTISNVTDAPTELFPKNVTAAIQSVSSLGSDNAIFAFLVQMIDFLTMMQATVGGAVAIGPDSLGIGASLPTHNRLYGYPAGYRQAGSIAWLQTQSWLKNYTAGCSLLDKVASVTGVGEGGFAAAAVAQALQGLGTRILKVYIGAAPLKTEMQFAHVVKTYDALSNGTTTQSSTTNSTNSNVTISLANNTNITVELSNTSSALQFFPPVFPLMLATFGLNIPGMNNTGTNQSSINPVWNTTNQNMLSWIVSPTPRSAATVASLVPPYLPELMNPNWLSLIHAAMATNESSPCSGNNVVAGVTDKLCEAVKSSDMSTMLINGTVICYSPDDSVVPQSQFPDSLFVQGSITKYPGLLSTPVTGDHSTALVSCSLSPIVQFALPANASDAPNLALPLQGNDLNYCMNITNTPTRSPESSPTNRTNNGNSGTQGGLLLSSSLIAATVAIFLFGM